MGRVIFPSGLQKKWFEEILNSNNTNVDSLARICDVSPRTIRDWKREKFTVSEKSANIIQKKFHIQLPSGVKFLDDYWYGLKGASKGGQRYLELYGAPGTQDGRSKGGKMSQLRRKDHPEIYPNCNIAKNFAMPSKNRNLAEAIGIILGDGGITYDQLKITLNNEVESEYIDYVANLLEEVFKVKPKRYLPKALKAKVCNVSLTGVNLIKLLSELGIVCRNKVRDQVTVPKWITDDQQFKVACLRGLIDTDGGVYYHKRIINSTVYFNLGLCFSNSSVPLINFVSKALKELGLASKIKGAHVYLYRIDEVLEYADKVKFHNQHHIKRLNEFLRLKNYGRSVAVVHRVRLESA